MYPEETIYEAVKALDENYDEVVNECPHPFRFIDGIPKEDAGSIVEALSEAYRPDYFEFTMHKDLKAPGCYSIAAAYMPSYKWLA